MCGIYGSVGFGGDPMAGLASIRHRGPDDAGEWSDREFDVWLGHRRLSIIDLSAAGHQPMVSPDGRFVMIYNGEIYNYRALREELEGKGEQFAGHSDSEVLLRLFSRDGVASFDRLNGIFAAAFWDRATKTMTLVRDPMGVKPLYVAIEGRRIAFASEMKALVRGGNVTPRVNPLGVLNHLGYLWSPGNATILGGVEKVRPGEVLQFQAQTGAVTRSIYSDPARPCSQYAPTNEADAAQDVRETIRHAVQRQMVSDVPLGAFLSGGLDSSAVVAFAAREMTKSRLQCFSIDVRGGFGTEGFSDDLPYARRVADHIGVDLHVVEADYRMMERLPEALYLLDEPNADPAALNALLISELARQQGITVLLSGAGGDDIFTGYRRHYALLQERWWRWWPRPLRSGLRHASAALSHGHPGMRRVAKAFESADLSDRERMIRYFLWIDPDRALGLLSPDFRQNLSTSDLFRPLESSLEASGQSSPLETMLYLEAKHFLADHNLNYTDKMGMAASVEVRVPLLDLEVVRCALSLPMSLRQKGRVGKAIFKKAMEPILPHDVIYRKKTGFGIPLRQWMAGPMRDLVEDSLSERRLADRGIFDPGAVRALIADTNAGRLDASYTIYSIMCIELWAQQVLDGAGDLRGQQTGSKVPEHRDPQVVTAASGGGS